MNNKKNIISAIFLQATTIISNLILPRLILSVFNSEVNGLVSSITQFLNFISLVEGGLGAVVLAKLYKPIENKQDEKIRDILAESQSYFVKIGIIFIVYTIFVAILFPILNKTELSYTYVSSLVVILSIATIIRYLFSITYKLYLQANQKVYLVNYTSSLIIILNLILAYVAIQICPSIHVVKFIADLLFIIQPILFKKFVEKKYHISLSFNKTKSNYLSNRWSGFAQHLAYFINMNTDIAVITIIIGLKEVSVYSIHMLAINALRNFISLLSNTYQSAFGKIYASNNVKKLKNSFIKLNNINWMLSLAAYATCYQLITIFVKIYTEGVTDISYYQPLFSSIIIMATFLYSICEPQRFLILAVGKFKKIKMIYIVEAAVNILISVLLAIQIGLIGVAIGTLIGITIRFIYFTIYLRNNIINLKYTYYIPLIIYTIIYITINIMAHKAIDLPIYNYFDLFLRGIIVLLIEVLPCASFYIIMARIAKAKKQEQNQLHS